MKIVIGGRYLIHSRKNMGRRIAIEVIGIDHRGYVTFREYPHKDPAEMYCDRTCIIESMVSPWAPAISQVKFIYKRRISAFKSR